jgi:hypothetical protein
MMTTERRRVGPGAAISLQEPNNMSEGRVRTVDFYVENSAMSVVDRKLRIHT